MTVNYYNERLSANNLGPMISKNNFAAFLPSSYTFSATHTYVTDLQPIVCPNSFEYRWSANEIGYYGVWAADVDALDDTDYLYVDLLRMPGPMTSAGSVLFYGVGTDGTPFAWGHMPLGAPIDVTSTVTLYLSGDLFYINT